jgi:hypothetical protein
VLLPLLTLLPAEPCVPLHTSELSLDVLLMST